jgi:hypothetical protein
MDSYFYRLGHAPELALAELKSLTKSDSGWEADRAWALGEGFLEVNQTGSLVYGGRITHRFNKNEISDLNLVTGLRESLKALRAHLPSEKKLGLAIEHNLQASNLIELGKEAGFKKINVLSKGKWPNFGNWKGTNAWILGFWLNQSFYLGFITSFSDQEFWTKLDQQLPHADMRRGIINLKLARSMINLVEADVVWDPFCGQARLLIAGADRKKVFWATDIDAVCLPQSEENWRVGQNLWKQSEIAKMEPVEQLDAADLDQFLDDHKINSHNLAIVTEGYLGFNFNRQPGLDNIQNEFKHQHKLWREILSKANTAGIKELVFCLPFYLLNGQVMYPNFLAKLCLKTGYSQIQALPYRRQDTITGHYIVLVRQNKTEKK